MSKAGSVPVAGIDVPDGVEPHLRAVLEAQPVVLSRVAKDGTFLAVNAAGLSMLGGESLEKILGTSLLALVSDGDRDGCAKFLDRASGGHRGSLEVDLNALTGHQHTLELHAAPHPGAPDGVPSVLITFRDVTESRRLEQSLVEAAARQAEQDAAHEAERVRLLGDLDLARRAQSDSLAADEQLTALERRLGEAEAERAAIAGRHAEEVAALQGVVEEYKAQLAQQEAELSALRTVQEAGASERQQLEEMATLLQAEAESRQQNLNELTSQLQSLEFEHQQALDTLGLLRSDLDARAAVVDELTTRVESLEREQEQTLEASAQVRHELEARNTLAGELAARVESLETEHATRVDALEGEHRARLAALEQEHGGLKAGIEAQLQEWQSRYEADTTALRDALNDAMAEQARLAESLAAGEENLAARAARVEALEVELADARSAHAAKVAEFESGHAAHLSELEAALAESRQMANDALAAAERADEAFSAERGRLEHALTDATVRERAAQAALAGAMEARTAAERGAQQLVAAIQNLAKQTTGDTAPVPVQASTQVRTLAERLESELPRRLGDGLALSLLVASPDSVIAAPERTVADAIGTFADGRRASMLSGQVTVELAEVLIDEGVGGQRGLAPGPYVLVAMTIEGPGAQQGFPEELFERADPGIWRKLRAEPQAARAAVVALNGQVWLSREGASIMIVEFYLPCAAGAGAR